jgi:hypothetical protein
MSYPTGAKPINLAMDTGTVDRRKMTVKVDRLESPRSWSYDSDETSPPPTQPLATLPTKIEHCRCLRF